jgi:hypothetical protein
MRKAEVFLHNQNPAVDSPSYYQKLSELRDLEKVKRAVRIGPRTFQLSPPLKNSSADVQLRNNLQYDQMVTTPLPGTPKSFNEAWTVRPSGGIPVRQLRTPRSVERE